MSNQENQEAQSFLLELTATKAEGTNEVELNLHKKMNCSIQFIANCIKAAMNQEEHIKMGILLAVAHTISESEVEDMEQMISSFAKGEA